MTTWKCTLSSYSLVIVLFALKKKIPQLEDEELVYDFFDEDHEVYEDEDDSNDENNWRNEYPDEDPDKSENLWTQNIKWMNRRVHSFYTYYFKGEVQ